MTRLLFALSFIGLAHTFVGYALLMWFRAVAAPRPIATANWEPRVDVVVIAHNAAADLAAKLANLLALDYPADKLRIHVASDGSEDLTASILADCTDARVHGTIFPVRRGKSACLGDVLPTLDADVIMFADVRQRLEPDALRALLRPLDDPEVGAVSGELMFEHPAGDFAGGIDAYWRYEKFIRRSESESGSVVGVSGALYVARRALLPRVPDGLILDDLWIPLQIAAGGARIVFAADARAWDRPSADAMLESQRKRRTLAGNFQLIMRDPTLLLPWAHPLGWRLWGHKWLRMLAPLLLATLFVTNAMLCASSGRWQLLLLMQVAFYAAAVAGMLLPPLLRHLSVRLATTFVRMNGYVVLGFLDAVRGGSGHLWAVTRQADTSARS